MFDLSTGKRMVVYIFVILVEESILLYLGALLHIHSYFMIGVYKNYYIDYKLGITERTLF